MQLCLSLGETRPEFDYLRVLVLLPLLAILLLKLYTITQIPEIG